MGETLEKASQQITEYWNGLEKSSKIKIGVISVLFVLIMGISVMVLTKPSYVNLLSGNMSPQKVGEIEKVLQTNNIKYRINFNGSSIMVDKDDVGKARILISTEGITGGEYAWRDMQNENMMGLTELEKTIRYKKLKEEDLVAAIKKIDGIAGVTVNLSIPNISPYVKKNNVEAKAGVQLDLYKELSDSQVRGIANFVASSVENLSINNVNISDTSPKVLFSVTDDGIGVSGSLTRNDEIKKAKEKEISAKVEGILSSFYDVIIVTPSLKIDFDKYKETRKEYSSPIQDGKKGMVSEEQVNTSVTQSNGSGGQPGLDSNNGNTEYLVGNGDSSKATTENRNTKYVLNEVVSQMERAQAIEILDESSLSVAVKKVNVLEYKDVKKAGLLKDTTWEEFKAKKRSEMGEIEIKPKRIELIKKATGIEEVAIEGQETVEFIDKQPISLPVKDYLPIVVIVIVIIALAVSLIKATKHHEIDHRDTELSVEQMLASTSNNSKDNDLLPTIEEHDSESKKRIEEFIKNKPELVAQLLRNWIAEDWE